MTSLLDRFNKQILGSKSKIFDFVAKISPSGDFKKIDGIEVIINSWNNILITPVGTYPFDKEFGSNLLYYIFEPSDNVTLTNIKNEIISKLSRYDDRARIKSVDVKFLKNKKGFNVAVQVEYNGETGELSAMIDETVYFDFLRQ